MADALQQLYGITSTERPGASERASA
jgi:hypothetical protein